MSDLVEFETGGLQAVGEPKHTPGPWHAMNKFRPSYSDHGYRKVASLNGRKGDIHIYAEASNMYQVGSGYVWGDAESDARLLAAAPELLEALRGMLQLDEENHQRYPGDEDVCAEVRLARAAIAKATGKKL